MEVVALSYFEQIVHAFLPPKATNFLSQKTVLCHSFLGEIASLAVPINALCHVSCF